MKAVQVQSDGSIKLPREILRVFPTTSRLALWLEGDMIVLKRLGSLKPSEIARRLPEKEMPLADIAVEVHRMRRDKRCRRG